MKRLLILLLLLTSPAGAADHYVTQAGAGSKDGSDFDNAFEGLPASLVRGDTYWIADGTYGAYTFDDAVDGTKSIYIRHANADSCGSVAGWAAELGDGQAIFSGPGGNTTGPFRVTTDYWVFDGMTGAGYGTTAYGFKVALSDTADNATVVQFGNGAEHITLRYFEVDGTDEGEAGVYKPRSDGIYFWIGTNTNVIVQNCYIHDVVRCHIQLAGASETTIENCYFDDSLGGNLRTGSYIHHEAIAIGGGALTANNHIRNNYFRDSGGNATGCIVFTNANASGYHIYGNCFWVTDAKYTLTNGYFATDGYSNIDSVYVYHNTYYNLDSVVNAFYVANAATDVIVKNNLLYNCDTNTFSANLTHDYNASDADLGEEHDVALAADPFVDADVGNFNIVLGAAAIGAGADLGATYTPDGNGTERAQTIGAFEYAAESAGDKVTWHVSVDGEGEGKSAADAMIYTSIPDSVGTGDTVLFAAGTYPAVLTMPADSVAVRNEAGAVVIFGGAKPLTAWTVPPAGGESVTDTLLTDGNTSFADSTHATYSTTTTGDVGRPNTPANTSRIALHFPLTTTNFASWDSAKVRLYCTLARTGTVKISVRVAEHAAIAANDSDTFQDVIANNTFTDSLTFNITNPTADTYYDFDISTIIDQLTIDGNNDLLVVFSDNGTASSSLYLRAAFIAHATAPEADLVYTYTQTGSPATFSYRALAEGAERLITRVWKEGVALTQVADSSLVESGKYAINDNKLYVAIGDTSGITCDGHGANAIDFNETTDVTVSGIVIDGRGYSDHAIYADGSRNSIYNLSIDRAIKGIYALGDTITFRNVAFAVTDTLLTETGTGAVYTHNGFDTDFEVPTSPGENDVLADSLWTGENYEPTEPMRDAGFNWGDAYNGTARDIGAGELKALAVATGYVRRYLFKAGYKPPLFGANRKTPIWSNQ